MATQTEQQFEHDFQHGDEYWFIRFGADYEVRTFGNSYGVAGGGFVDFRIDSIDIDITEVYMTDSDDEPSLRDWKSLSEDVREMILGECKGHAETQFDQEVLH